jgi:hypothetical protein
MLGLEYTRKRRDAIERAGLLEEAGDDDEVGDDQALEYTSDDDVVRPEGSTGQINAVASDPLPVRRAGLAAEFGRPGSKDAITRPVDVSEPPARVPPSGQPAPVQPPIEASAPGTPSIGRFPSVTSPASLEASPAPQQVSSAPQQASSAEVAPPRDPDPRLPRVRGDGGVNLGSAFDESRRVQHPSRVNREPSPPSSEPSPPSSEPIRSVSDPDDDEAPLIDLTSAGRDSGETGDDLDVDAITGETPLYRGRRRRA